ncbi:MAG: ATP-dependent RecD-like DNA helicase [Planctomycetota bacterium]
MVANAESEAEVTVEGQLERLVYESSETGFVVARFEPDHGRLLTITGTLGGLMPGERLRLRGRWVEHPRFGLQLQVRAAEPLGPPSLAGVRRYLEGGAIAGVGPVIADRLIEAFGDDLPRILTEEPEKLLSVPGLGIKRVRQIVEGWTKRQESRDAFIFLQGHGLGPVQAAKVYQTYGADTVRVVRENPYRLIDEISGVGFRTADRIARELGFDPNGEQRLRAGVMYVLQDATSEGHIYLPAELLVQRAAACLSADESRVTSLIQQLAAAHLLVTEKLPDGQDVVYQPLLRAAEHALAESLLTLGAAPNELGSFDVERAIVRAESRAQLSLTEAQRAAIRTALKAKISIITGGPGVGKTTIIRILVMILNSRQVSLALAAPTGRAAKRLALLAHVEASTLHRLLRFDPQTGFFGHDASNPLPRAFVIVDEVSMCDVPLTRALLDALHPSTHLLLVGDADQLPSVGPGNVLRDLIDSGAFPVSRLDTVFRQSERNPIIQAAHMIRVGGMPEFRVEQNEGIAFVKEEDPDCLRETVVDLVCRRLPQRLGCTPDDVQVLSPMIRGPAGVMSLNKALQAKLNPPSDGENASTGERAVIRQGDRVMQIRNNYEHNVFNGDVGRVVLLASSPLRVTVQFEDKAVTYAEGSLDQLLLSYAITIHRSQGCEFPIVVVPLTTQHRLLLRRNILYTAVTRARRLVVLAGTRRALAIAVHDDRLAARFTSLAWRLGKGTAPAPREKPAWDLGWADEDDLKLL